LNDVHNVFSTLIFLLITMSKLLKAIEKGDSDKALRLINEDVDEYGNSPLLLACKNKLVEVALRLIKHGRNLNFRNYHNETPLIVACDRNLTKVAVKLIKAGVKLDRQDKKGYTALMMSVKNNNQKINNLLIERKANLNLQDNAGNTALHWGCAFSCSQIALSLIKAKAELNLMSKNGDTSLIVATSNGLEKVVFKLIENNADLNCQNKVGCTALIHACDKKLEMLALHFITKGANLNLMTESRNMALDFAIYNNLVPVVRSLIWHGCYGRTIETANKTIQKMLSFNFRQYPIRRLFTLNDTNLLIPFNYQKVKMLLLVRNVDNDFAKIPLELFEVILSYLF